MRYQYIPYTLLPIASSFISLSLGVYALLKRRHVKGAINFMLSMLVVTIWSAANAFEISSIDFYTKLFWANIQYFAYCFSPVTLLALCMEFTGYDKWVKSRKMLWMIVIPTIIIILVWTDRLHGLIRYDMHIDYSGYFPVIAKKYGPVFFIHAAYSHFLNMFAGVLLIRTVFLKNTVHRKQAIVLLFGVSLIVIPNILYILGITPIKRFDITPAFFGPAGLIIAWGIFHYKLFDLVPLARTTVIETMEAGILVLDLQDRILDINPAFEKIIGFNGSQIFTKTVVEVCGKIPELARACIDRSITHKGFSIILDGFPKFYEVMFSPLTDDKGTLIGRLAVIYDITEKKQAQQEFLRQQWKLAVIEERENLAREMHDNLGQVLGFLNLQAQGIRQELLNAGVEIAATKLDKLVDVAQSAHQEIREYICNARNSAITEKNFSSALTKYIMDFEEHTGLKIELDSSSGFSGEELELNVRMNLLNIIREALNNIRKHAEAKHVKIIFLLTETHLYLTIKDDGKGFDTVQYEHGVKTKFGLDIMRERATQVGAQIDIQSAIGTGTRIGFCVLLKGEKKKNADEINAGR